MDDPCKQEKCIYGNKIRRNSSILARTVCWIKTSKRFSESRFLAQVQLINIRAFISPVWKDAMMPKFKHLHVTVPVQAGVSYHKIIHHTPETNMRVVSMGFRLLSLNQSCTNWQLKVIFIFSSQVLKSSVCHAHNQYFFPGRKKSQRVARCILLHVVHTTYMKCYYVPALLWWTDTSK